ncbi:hypothetical protein [Nitrosospira sp. NRS527]|uniref:hypothetical protein n=1 Tax=Nitrosospira sp. NRS527 TaxID=155925 RepID=UPI001AF65630|nr:hypothetical protein [Nitrosospira sp. NRS527]BCT67326.1 hypothetical protein NNRS527_00908 [Nitrosospira sp. NRS527]
MTTKLGFPPLHNQGLVKAVQAGSVKGAALATVIVSSKPFRSELPVFVHSTKSGQFATTKVGKKS